jgi:hypothetical protein
MDPYIAEIMSEVGLHHGTGASVQRLSWCAQHLVHQGRGAAC